MRHVESLLALVRLTGATSRPTFREGLQKFHFNAIKTDESTGEIGQSVDNSLVTTIKLKSFGSIALCIQCIFPYLLSSSIMSKVTIIGRAQLMNTPTIDYMYRVFIPIMKQIGYQFNTHMFQRGFYPRGNGLVELNIPCPTKPNGGKFHSFNLTQRGKLVKSIDGTYIKLIQTRHASVEYFLKYENAVLGFYRFVEEKSPNATMDAFLDAIDEIEAEFTDFYNSSVTVDKYLNDQLIIFMILVKLQNPNSVSEFTTLGLISNHLLSAIYVAEKFTGLKFTISLSENIVHVSL